MQYALHTMLAMDHHGNALQIGFILPANEDAETLATAWAVRNGSAERVPCVATVMIYDGRRSSRAHDCEMYHCRALQHACSRSSVEPSCCASTL